MSDQLWLVCHNRREAFHAGEAHWWPFYTFARYGESLSVSHTRNSVVHTAAHDQSLLSMAADICLWLDRLGDSESVRAYIDSGDLPWDDNPVGWTCWRKIASKAAKVPKPVEVSPTLYISVDLEFTDGFPSGEIMQLGAAVHFEGAEVAATPMQLPRTYQIRTLPVKGPANTWVRENLRGLYGACLDTPGRYAYAELSDFVSWVKEWQTAVGVEKAYMVAWCGTSDWGLLARDLEALGLDNPFHYTCHEIQTLLLATGLPKMEHDELNRLLGVKPNAQPHNALADATYQLALFNGLRRWLKDCRVTETP